MLLKINVLDEFRPEAYKNIKIYKESMKRWHDFQIVHREFLQRQLDLVYNSRLRLSQVS